jgi:nucleotide-binding universal stress UspA family protein
VVLRADGGARGRTYGPVTASEAINKKRGIEMFKKVIVGDDGLDGGADALALARALAPGAELILASAYPWDATPSRFMQLGYGNILRDDTKKALRKRLEEAGLPDARPIAIPDTSPARALHHLAEAEGADLVVTGTARHGTFGRMMLGNVSRDVLHGSPCPVAVAPRGFAAGPPATIGIAYDHSPEAEKALTLAVATATALGARVKVREVVASDLLPTIAGYPIVGMDDIAKDLVDDARERLAERVAMLDAGVDIEVEAVAGGAADRLDELAADVDLLVCGSRGWGSIRRVVLGSTANRLIHHAACPVLIVPRTADAGAADTPAEASAATA